MGGNPVRLKEPPGKLRHRHVRRLLHHRDREVQMVRQRTLARRTTALVCYRLAVLGRASCSTNRRTEAHRKAPRRRPTRLAFTHRTRNTNP
jgi:hypothetical protein